jgi:carbon-monoxide dehydrogenase medium subunit
MILPKFSYFEPKQVSEACSLLEEYGDEAKVLAGGTILLVKMKQGLLNPKYLVSLRNLVELDFIRFDGQTGLALGAMTSLNSILESPLVRENYYALAEAVESMAAVQIRNSATLGGNLGNASPAADSAPALMAYDAKVKLVGPKGERLVALEDFFTGPGETVLNKGEIIAEIILPPLAGSTGGAYQRFGLRKSSALAVACAAAVIAFEDGVCRSARIALGAVAPVPLRVPAAEEVLAGKTLNDGAIAAAGKQARESARPITDIRGSQGYRRELTEVLVTRAISQALKRAKQGE